MEMVIHRFIDHMDHGVNEMFCSCGVRLWPDCDVSRVSINKCWQEHLDKVGAVPYDE